MNPGSDPVEFTFTRNQGRTPSDNTGPSSDHTTGGGEAWIGLFQFDNITVLEI